MHLLPRRDSTGLYHPLFECIVFIVSEHDMRDIVIKQNIMVDPNQVIIHDGPARCPIAVTVTRPTYNRLVTELELLYAERQKKNTG